MAYFDWTSAMETGHTEIDEQHKKMFLLAEAAVDPLLNSAEHKPDAAQLRALVDFTQEHFSFEQDLMRSTGYPGADQHAKFHDSLLAELRTYSFRVQTGMHTNPAGLSAFLWSWLVLHINSEDRNLVAWIKSHESDGGQSKATRNSAT